MSEGLECTELFKVPLVAPTICKHTHLFIHYLYITNMLFSSPTTPFPHQLLPTCLTFLFPCPTPYISLQSIHSRVSQEPRTASRIFQSLWEHTTGPFCMYHDELSHQIHLCAAEKRLNRTHGPGLCDHKEHTGDEQAVYLPFLRDSVSSQGFLIRCCWSNGKAI